MLRYMADSTSENVVNHDLKYIQDMINDIKMDSERGVRYMQSWEIEQICFDEGKIEGKIDSILEILSELGDIPHPLIKVIQAQNRSEVLSEWLKIAARVSSISEFEENIEQR